MNLSKSSIVAVYAGLIASVIGAIAFTISWNSWTLFDGSLPGYQFFLFPGNLTLMYFWHPLFTEEVNFWPKLAMLLSGQFVVVTGFVGLIMHLRNRLGVQPS
jgi:hypothetical protein